jgi:hypothetical protein
LPPQLRVFWQRQAGVGREELIGCAAGLFEQLLIASQVGDPQRRQAVLLSAK